MINNNFLVINKWSDIATQGGSKVNVSIDHIIKNINPDYRLVHRLDKETSGLLLISKNLKYARYFSTLFKQHLITKFYIALCEGSPKNKNSKVLLNIKNKKRGNVMIFNSLNFNFRSVKLVKNPDCKNKNFHG